MDAVVRGRNRRVDVPFAAGSSTGVAEKRHPNGAVAWRAGFASGKREGPSLEFQIDGRKKSEWSYRADRMEGPWTFWKDDGEIDREKSGDYARGERTGG